MLADHLLHVHQVNPVELRHERGFARVLDQALQHSPRDGSDVEIVRHGEPELDQLDAQGIALGFPVTA
jgi:hypothetical protein